MHIHPNTVQQRLERVRALLRGDMNDPEFRFRLQSAVRLERLRRTVSASAQPAVGPISGSRDGGDENRPELVRDQMPHSGVDPQL
jgi:hypothetical protein